MFFSGYAQPLLYDREFGYNAFNNYPSVKNKMELLHKIRNARSLVYKEPDSALLLYQRVYSEARQAGFTYGMHLSLIGMGVIYTDKGDYKRSRSIYERVLNAPSYPKKKRLLPSLYVNLAKISIYEGDFAGGYAFLDSALHYTHRDTQVLDTATLATIYSNAGSILRTIGETRKALEYLNLAQQGAVALKDTGLLSAVYNNFVSCYKGLKDYGQAIAYSNRSIELNLQSNDLKSQAYSFSTRGTIHLDLKQYDKALLYFEKADDLLRKHAINDHRLELFVYLTLGELYLATKNMDKARNYLETGKQRAFKQKDLVMQYKSLLGLSRYQAERYNYPMAYKELLQAHQLYDTLLNKDNHKNINELETKYRTLEKDRKLVVQSLQLSQKEKTIQQKNFLIYGITLSALFITLVTGLVIRHKSKLRVIKQSNLKKDMEISLFKSMLKGEETERSRLARELHDGIISQLTAVKVRFSAFLQPDHKFDPVSFEEGYQYLDETMRDLRKTAHNLMPEAVAKGGLVGALSDFCSKMDNVNTTRVYFLTSGYFTLEKTLELSLYRIIQELVQNALKYAAAKELLVQVNFYDQMIGITVEDDGQGFDRDYSKGAGLSGISERVKMMNGHIELLTDEDHGTTVYIEIPLTKELKRAD